MAYVPHVTLRSCPLQTLPLATAKHMHVRKHHTAGICWLATCTGHPTIPWNVALRAIRRNADLAAGEVVSLKEAQERARVYEAQGLQQTYVMDYT